MAFEADDNLDHPAIKRGLSKQRLEAFHRKYKFTLLAHDEARYRMLGRHVAQSDSTQITVAGKLYISEFMRALEKIATPKLHANVLMHIMGFLKHKISATDKEKLLKAIHNYRLGRIRREAPLKLIRHHLKLHPDAYLNDQYYLK